MSARDLAYWQSFESAAPKAIGFAGVLAALIRLLEACEERANQEGGDFGPLIGPAAREAEIAIAKATGGAA